MEVFPYEFSKPLLLCFDVLERCNMRFFDEGFPFLKKYGRFFFLVPFVLVNYISMSFHMYRVFSSNATILELAYMVPIYLILTQDFLKIAFLLEKKSQVRKLVTRLGEMWRTDNLTDLQIEKKNSYLKRLNFSNTAFYWANVVGSWEHLTAPLLITCFQKFVLQQETELLLPFGCVFPFDQYKNWLRYLAVYVFQFYTTLRTVYHYFGTDMLMVTLCALLSTEFALLREDLKHIKPTKGTYEINKDWRGNEREHIYKIKNFILNHQVLIELTDLLNDIFGKIVFINMFFATVIICFFGFGLSVAHETVEIANNFVAVFALSLPIFILCYYAELLAEESAKIADSAYANLWYRGDEEYQKFIRLIIIRSQRPCYLLSLNYAPITLNTFTKVVSTTWSYMSLARSMLEEN